MKESAKKPVSQLHKVMKNEDLMTLKTQVIVTPKESFFVVEAFAL